MPHRTAVILSLQLSGLSHSEIPGSRVICTLPGLIAAYHVLHRLREPRHPPVALFLLFFCLNYTSSFCSTLLVFRVKLSTILFTIEIYFVYKLSMNGCTFELCGVKATDLNRVRSRIAFQSSSLSFSVLPFTLVVPGRVELPTSTLSV